MSYFKPTSLQCAHYPAEWDRVLHQIQGWNRGEPVSSEIGQALEAKALYVFTVARRLTRATLWLRERANDWRPIFLEASVLLFPMIELIGHARVDRGQVRTQYPGGKGKNKEKDDVSNINLWAGLHWLLDPGWLPEVKDKKQKSDPTVLYRWQIGHLVLLRSYLLHGLKRPKDEKDNRIPIQDIISIEFPEWVTRNVQPAMADYWQLLRQDDGNKSWLKRLADADIWPLPIRGSGLFEKGLIDPNIVDYLDRKISI